MILAGSTFQVAQEVPLYRSRPDSFPTTEAAPVNAIQVLLIDHLLEALTGPLVGLHARQALAK